MTLFDKISALETTFTTAKDDLQALQQSVQAHLESFVQESLETTKTQAKEFFTKELETTAQTLNAQNIAQVQELFSKNLHALAQEISQSIDLEGISRQVARDFSDRNATNLAQTLKQILAGFKLDSKIQALESKARELTQNYKDTLDQLISDFGTAASIKLQAYLDQNAPKLLAALDLAAITHAVQEKITPQINLQELESKALESAKKSIDNLLSTLESQEQILESLENKAKNIALQAMQSDEVIKMRYETALRLQSLKCFASQEIIANIIELNAKRKNYEGIITNALNGADKKIYLSI